MERLPAGSTFDFDTRHLDGHDYIVLGKSVARVHSWGPNGLTANSVTECSTEEVARVLAVPFQIVQQDSSQVRAAKGDL